MSAEAVEDSCEHVADENQFEALPRFAREVLPAGAYKRANVSDLLGIV